VVGSHTYAQTGSFPISVVIHDQAGNTVSAIQTVDVSRPVPAVEAAWAVPNSIGQANELIVQLMGPVPSGRARCLANYQVLEHKARGGFQSIPLTRLFYRSATRTVLLFSRRPFELTNTTVLEVHGMGSTTIASVPVSGASAEPALALALHRHPRKRG